ncbi:uncharacterized protein LOC141538307 [Cotesia typhae]|uniref:uncharacterized protein LOC141538307 n=1 Tax=Cotesia typhae TaxID=2053667 RepID=UPI003D6871F7
MNIHVPNLCVVQQVCNVCCDIDDLELGTTRPWCNNCGVCEAIFHGEDCVEKFVDYILEISKPKTCKNVVCIAHNAKGFDAQFILTELFNRQLSDIDTIMTGTSVTLIELNSKKIKFIDSLNFISASLSALPKSFGFEDKMRKGYFPHFFNSRANQDYIGVMPDKQFYGFNSMSEKSTSPKKSEKQEFLEWRNYLKEKQIGILPRSGYRLADNQSRLAIEWLTWLEHSQNIKIIHALRGREVIIPGGIKLDGYREAEDGQKFAYQFHVQEDCYHNCASERELYGTWVSCELRKAVEKGYIIQEIDDIWSYNTVRYIPGDDNNTGLFVEYINTFLKIKQEASGWPVHCVDEHSRQEYIDNYEAREGITLDANKIAKNPGLRSLAKLFLNSFWSKFGQRENMTKKSIVKNYNELIDLAFNPEIEVTSLLPVNDETVFVSWQNNSECYSPSDRANVVIAAFTTAQARLKLYNYLDVLNEKVLYYDTDSIIYVSDGKNDLATGDFLGDLTDELESYGKGSYISSFVSGGPKFYSYVIKHEGKTSECSKLKGVKINGSTEKLINYNSIRSLVVDQEKEFLVSYSGIRRDNYHQVITKKETKIIRVTGPKRRREGEADTYPYGKVIFCYAEWQKGYTEYDKTFVEFREGLPQSSDFDDNLPKLVVIDDLMREASNGAIVDLFTKGSHHKNLSVMFLSQNLFHQGKGQRDISLNTNYIVVFKNPRDRAQIFHLARQVYPEDPKFLQEAYFDATSKAHGYLLLDLKQSTPENCRFRTCIFPSDQYHYVYIPKKVNSIKSVNSSTNVPVLPL